MNIKQMHSGTLLLFVALLPWGSGCKQRTPTEASKAVIDLSSVGRPGERILFDELRDVNRIPKGIVTSLGGTFANPTEKFRETDTSDASLPMRRLVIAGIADRYAVVHYEKGGLSDYFVIALFSRSNDDGKLIWISTSRRISDLAELKSELESGKLKDERGKIAY